MTVFLSPDLQGHLRYLVFVQTRHFHPCFCFLSHKAESVGAVWPKMSHKSVRCRRSFSPLVITIPARTLWREFGTDEQLPASSVNLSFTKRKMNSAKNCRRRKGRDTSAQSHNPNPNANPVSFLMSTTCSVDLQRAVVEIYPKKATSNLTLCINVFVAGMQY